MPSLLDIAPPELSDAGITVGGVPKLAHGLRALTYAQLLRRFPGMALAAAGREIADEERVPMMLEAAPALIAAAMGHPGDAGLEAEIAAELSVEEATSAFVKILDLTFPTGKATPGPLAGNGADGSTKAPGLRSARQ